MERIETGKRCGYQGLTYDDGSGLCVVDKCMVCNDGKWEDDDLHEVYPPTS